MLSKHYYALSLAASNSVYFLSPGRSAYEHAHFPSNIHILDTPRKIPGLRHLPDFIRRRMMMVQVKSVLDQMETLPTVVWSFDNSWLYELDLFGSSCLKIGHVVDFNMDFQTERFAMTSDICLGITDDIVKRLSRHQAKSFKLGHGYFEMVTEDPPAEKVFTAFYGGNLLIPYINRHMLLTLVKRHPAVRFAFVGSMGKGNLNNSVSEEDQFFIDNLKERDNVILKARLNPQEYRAEIAKADVCLLVYDHENYAHQAANSHKILEYFGAGKAVISFPIEAYKDNPLLITCHTEKAYEDTFDQVVADPKSVSGQSQIAERKLFALQRSYTNRIAQIQKLLNDHVQH